MAEEAPGLALSWVFGNSTQLKNNVVNLSDGYSDRLCYVAAHTGIIYDKKTRKQIFLQGHCNAIVCLSVTEDRSTIITADVGQESLLVLWNSTTGVPIKSIPRAHANGIVAMDIAPGGEWLATISAPDPVTGEQDIALWAMGSLLADAAPKPAVLSAIPTGDPQLAVKFNQNQLSELMSNGKRRVYFWHAQHPGSGRFKYYSPPLRSRDFKQPVGDFVMSAFVPGSVQALTATADGDLVVWDEQGITAQMGTRATDRRAVKLMRIHQQAITYLGTIGDYIVSGGRDGFVRFYDPLLRIVAWFEDLGAGPVTGLSFSAALPERVAHAELADTLNRFMVPDFVVATEEGRLVAVVAASFEEYDAARRKGTEIVSPLITDVTDVAAHPTRAEFAVLGRSGMLQRWDGVRHTCVGQRAFTKAPGAKLVYARDGSFMVAGFEGGHLSFVSTEDLTDVFVARNTPAHIVRLATAATGVHVAAADEANHVLLYAHLPYKHIMRWEFVGKAHAHHSPIVGLSFGETPAGQTRLFSMGADARVVEYDIDGSNPGTGLRILSHQDFAAGAVPTALSFAPPLQYFKHHAAQTLLLMSDDTYKLRLYDPDMQASVATMLGPTFGGPLKQLLMFKSATSDNAFLAYATGDRVVGLVSWPCDGDPAQTLGLIAHPGPVTALAISYDGRKLLTAGADGTLGMWDVSTKVLEAQAAASAAQAGGRWQRVLDNPALLEDLRDYFTYAQVKAQGEDSMATRDVRGLVPVAMVPDLMRAAGFYPSEAAIRDIMNHISFIAHSRDLDTLTHLDFDTFLQLYLNHRPLFDVSAEDLQAAFTALGAPPAHGRLTREALLVALQQAGERMSGEELLGVLQALTGADRAQDALPPALDAHTFSAEVLGFDEGTVA